MKRFQQATSKPYGYLVIDLKSSKPEHNRLRNDIFEANNPEFRKRMDIPPENQLHCEGNSSDTTINDDDDDDENDDDEDADDGTDKEHIEGDDRGVKRQAFFIGPPGKRIKEELKEERKRNDIWDRRFQKPLRQFCKEQFKDGLNSYIDQEYSFDEAYARTANDALPHLRKKMRQNYAQFLIDFYALQEDPTQQQILQSAKKLRHQHNMTIEESI
jgi:hypothetical protein